MELIKTVYNFRGLDPVIVLGNGKLPDIDLPWKDLKTIEREWIMSADELAGNW